MSVENKSREKMSEWKMLQGEAEKKAFLQQMKADIDSQDGEALLDGMKALNVLIKDLHEEVMASAATTEKTVVSPTSEEEATPLRSLLKKMNMKSTEVKIA